MAIFVSGWKFLRIASACSALYFWVKFNMCVDISVTLAMSLPSNNRLRTTDLPLSAPTRWVPVAEVPSEKWAVTKSSSRSVWKETSLLPCCFEEESQVNCNSCYFRWNEDEKSLRKLTSI